MLDNLYGAFEGKHPVQTDATLPSEKSVRHAADTLRGLSSKLDELVRYAKKTGLSNSALAGVAVDSIRTRSEEILDIVDFLDLILDPEIKPDDIVANSLAALQRNELFDLSAIT